jgi:hypothetical protein
MRLSYDQLDALERIHEGRTKLAGSGVVRSVRALIRRGLVSGRETDVLIGHTLEGCPCYRRGHEDLELTEDGEALVGLLLLKRFREGRR